MISQMISFMGFTPGVHKARVIYEPYNAYGFVCSPELRGYIKVGDVITVECNGKIIWQRPTDDGRVSRYLVPPYILQKEMPEELAKANTLKEGDGVQACWGQYTDDYDMIIENGTIEHVYENGMVFVSGEERFVCPWFLCKPLNLEQPIVINGHNVKIGKNSIRIGCTTVSKEIIEEIQKRMSECT